MSQTEWRRSALAMPFVALGLVVTLAAQQAPRVIEVKAKKYDFEPSTIEVQQGERVVLRVTSTDRLHGIGIKKFGVNREVPEGANSGRRVRRRRAPAPSRCSAPRTAARATTTWWARSSSRR